MKNFGPRLFPFMIVGALALLLSSCGFRNKETPAGYVGYVTQSAIFGKTTFVGLQTGPTSTGLTFLVDVTNVSVTPFTYDEEFSGNSAIIAKDTLKMSASVHALFQVNPERVKDFVEKYSTLHQGDSPDAVVKVAYANFIKEPLRTMARNRMEGYEGLQIAANIPKIGEEITEDLLTLLKDTPFKLISVRMGNVQPPENVATAVALKIAAGQELERKATEIKIAVQEATRRTAEAQGIADSMDKINAKLTKEYLQYEAIKAQAAMIGSPNHTTIYIPVGPMGVPIVGTTELGGHPDQK